MRGDYGEISKRDAEVICVADKEMAEEAKKLKEELNLGFPVAVDSKRVVAKSYAPDTIEPKRFPWLFIIDKAGRLRLSHISETGLPSRETVLRTLDEIIKVS